MAQLSLNEKLKIAIETLLTGKLKDNHDDTLFEKFCSLLQSDIEVDRLMQFITEQSIFKLINNNLPLFENAEYVRKHRDDCVAFFRILGTLLSHEEVFNLYQTKKTDIFDITQIFGQLFPLFDDLKNENSMLLVFSMLSFMKNVSCHKSGTQWLLTLWFEGPDESASKFILYIIPFIKSQKTHYIQKETNSLLGRIIDLNEQVVGSSAPLYEAFCASLDKHLLSQFNLPEGRLVIEILQLIDNKETFIHRHQLVNLASEFLQRSNLNGDDLSCLTKLVCLISNLHKNDLTPVSELLDLTLAKLRTPNHCFSLVSFLSLAINLDYPCDGSASIRDLWFALMTKLLSLVKSHYLGADIPESDIVADHDQLAVQAFHSMSYGTFEFNCLRILNKIDCQLLNCSDILLLTGTLKQVVGKIRNRKHAIFIVTFFDEALKCKCDQPEVVSEMLSIYDLILRQMPQYRSFILKSLRSMFEQSLSILATEAILAQICHILDYFVEYFKEADHSEDNELSEMILETLFSLYQHLDLKQVSQMDAHSEKCLKLLKQMMDFEFALLPSAALDPSSRANIVSSLYCIFRYGFESTTVPLPLNDSSNFDAILLSSYDYDLTYRQSLYCNLKSILNQSPIRGADEARFLLPFLIKFCTEEVDTELECILLQMIQLTSCTLLQATDNGLQELLDCGVFGLIYTLIHEPLIMYRTKLATLTLHETIISQLNGTHFTAKEELDFSRSPAFKEVIAEEAYTFCRNTSTGDLRRWVEKERDCPQVNILDDIIFTSLSEDMVMDCY